MTEPDVALTDFALAVECAVFAAILYKEYGGRGCAAGAERDAGPGGYKNNQTLRRLWALFFGSVGVAALTGGIVHGFFLDPDTLGNVILWPATLLVIGVTAWTGWAIGARLLFSPARAYHVSCIAGLGCVAYAAYLLAVSQEFVVALSFYLPAVVFLLGALLATVARTRARPVLLGAAGLVLTFIASAIQQSDLDLHPTYFNHNAIYHVLEAVALWLLFICARWLVATDAREGASHADQTQFIET